MNTAKLYNRGPVSLEDSQRAEREQIERYIDGYLMETRWFPVCVPEVKSGWSQSNIDAVLARYRVAGWHVYPVGHGWLAGFDLPEETK